MIVLDYSDRRPIYEQIISKLEDLILRGILAEDAPLPSVRSMAMDLAINPNTIQRAYASLERDGWIYSVRGKGSFVAGGGRAKDRRRTELFGQLTKLIAELKVSFAEDGTPYVLNVLGTLSSGAVRVVFDEATVQFAQPGCSLILSAGVFVGASPLAWTVDRSAFTPRRTAHLRFPGGEVYLDVAANGTLMMFR